MAIERAVGEYVALVDDDEWPAGRMWLLTLFRTLGEHAADGVLGPVIPRYAEGSPQWLIDGKFYERPAHATGSRLTPLQCRTGNALLRTSVFAAVGAPSFRFEIPYGEDRDFFRRAVERRQVFIWCAEAGVFEEVPPGRWKRSFMLKMALLRGQTSLRRSTSAPTDVATSVVAVPCYALALPIALVLGHHRFMSCLVRLCDHLGRLMAVAGVGAIKHPYVSD
jgi:hypothetical protein